MKIVSQSPVGKGIGNFVWDVSPPVKDALEALEQYEREQENGRAKEEKSHVASIVLVEIDEQISSLLWAISAAYALGGQESVELLNEINATLFTLHGKAEAMMEKKFGKGA